MATRTLLCVEPDEAALAVIVGTLEPYGFDIVNIIDGERVVDRARKNRPALMIVSVEPKKIGYAICNKIKRSAELKDIPLILISAEETPEKFEQHKTFKLRADEYMFKPLDRHELMRKVNVLVGLDEPEEDAGPSASAEIFLSSDVVSSEIAIEADDIVDEAKLTSKPDEPQDAAAGEDLLSNNPAMDPMFDKETEAAFDALKMATPPPASGTEETAPLSTASKDISAAKPLGRAPVGKDVPGQVSVAPQPQPPSDGWRPMGTANAAATRFDMEDLRESLRSDQASEQASEERAAIPQPVEMPEPETAEIPAPPAEIEGDPELLRRPPMEDAIPLPEEVRNTSVVAGAAARAQDAAFSELQKRVHELEDEKHELSAVIDDLRTHLHAQPLHKERDLLELREAINRKEKDVLDLRDALDAKDRQILDQKDRMREHERARRDLEEKMITFEKNLMYANEKVLALGQDKEKSIERERGLKTRLEDAHTEISKTHDELDVLKKRLALVEERSRQELEKVRADLEARIAEEEEAHRTEIGRLREDREAEKISRENEFQAELGRLNSGHATEIELLHKRHAEEKGMLEDGHEIELARVRRENEKAMQGLREEFATATEKEKHTHQIALEAKERESKNELSEQRRNSDAALAAAEDRRRREVEEVETRRATELDTADARRRSELQARDEQHHAATAELERRHLAERTELSEKQRADLEQASKRSSEVEAELAVRSEELAETHRRLHRVEGELDTSRTDVRDREVKLSQARDKITELENKVADLEEQALRAYRRIKDDEKTIDKAKRAVSVALTLLDERNTGGTPPAPRSGEEPQS